MTHDHAEVGDMFDGLEAALEAGDAARAHALLDLVWARLAVHIRAEHLGLFPAILNAPKERFAGGAPRFDEAQAAVAVLKDDHDFFMRELAEAVNLMRGIKPVADASLKGTVRDVRRIVGGVRARLDRHNASEEQQVYKWTELLLDERERTRLRERVKRELEKTPPRFAGHPAFKPSGGE